MSSMTHKMWNQWKDFRLNEGDHEGDMAKSQLERCMKLSKMIYQKIENGDSDGDGKVQLPAWLQSELTIALESLQGVHTYLDGKDGLKEVDSGGTYVPGSLKGKGVNSFPMLKYSSPEAKQFVEQDIKQMGKFFNKASAQTIKVMMDGVKNNKYDAMDLIRGIKTGPTGDTSVGVRDMIGVLWTKVDKRFRSYLRGKKRR